MDPVISTRPLLAVAVAGLAALAILFLNKREKLRDAVSPIAAVAMFAIVVSMAPTVLAGGTVELRLFEVLPGIDVALRADALGMVFATVSSLLWIVAAVYSIGYMRHLHEHAQTRFSPASPPASRPQWAAPSPQICSRWLSSTRC